MISLNASLRRLKEASASFLSLLFVAGLSVAGLPTMEATVAEMAEAEGADSYVLGCSCASNAPGGGAIANAEVSGVSLASLMAMAAA